MRRAYIYRCRPFTIRGVITGVYLFQRFNARGALGGSRKEGRVSNLCTLVVCGWGRYMYMDIVLDRSFTSPEVAKHDTLYIVPFVHILPVCNVRWFRFSLCMPSSEHNSICNQQGKSTMLKLIWTLAFPSIVETCTKKTLPLHVFTAKQNAKISEESDHRFTCPLGYPRAQPRSVQWRALPYPKSRNRGTVWKNDEQTHENRRDSTNTTSEKAWTMHLVQYGYIRCQV